MSNQQEVLPVGLAQTAEFEQWAKSLSRREVANLLLNLRRHERSSVDSFDEACLRVSTLLLEIIYAHRKGLNCGQDIYGMKKEVLCLCTVFRQMQSHHLFDSLGRLGFSCPSNLY